MSSCLRSLQHAGLFDLEAVVTDVQLPVFDSMLVTGSVAKAVSLCILSSLFTREHAYSIVLLSSTSLHLVPHQPHACRAYV